MLYAKPDNEQWMIETVECNGGVRLITFDTCEETGARSVCDITQIEHELKRSDFIYLAAFLGEREIGNVEVDCVTVDFGRATTREGQMKKIIERLMEIS